MLHPDDKMIERHKLFVGQLTKLQERFNISIEESAFIYTTLGAGAAALSYDDEGRDEMIQVYAAITVATSVMQDDGDSLIEGLVRGMMKTAKEESGEDSDDNED